MSILIVLPSYNNAGTLKRVVEGLIEIHPEVLIVNDGSTDTSSDIIKNLQKKYLTLKLIQHEQNKGKGEAIRSGFSYANKHGFEGIIICDTDGQHLKESLDIFLQHGTNFPKEIGIGARQFKENVPFSSKFGRWFSNFWVWVETGFWLNDTQSGYRYYPVNFDIVQKTKCQHYDFEIEILVHFIWRRYQAREYIIEVYYPPREERVSHFKAGLDNWRLSKLHSQLTCKRWFSFIWKSK